MRLSLILPIYNGCEDLKKNFMPIYRALGRGRDAEIIIAEDGSTDGTREAAKRFARLKNVRLVSKKQRAGKGRAIRDAIAIARGEVIGYMDIDLAVPLEYVMKAVGRVEMGNDIVIGSRYVAGAEAQRSAYRLLESVVYNLMMRVFLGSRVKDHQCGFKFFRASYIKDNVGKIKDEHFFFDAEMLVRAQRNGIVPYEMPVAWHEGSKTNVKASDTIYFLKSIFKLRKELRAENG